MPKVLTGAKTVEQLPKLELRKLIDIGLIKPGYVSDWAQIDWSGREDLSAQLMACWQDNDLYIRLKYSIAGQLYGVTINIDRKPSNLGKGHTLCFICPITGKRCRTLYMAYGSSEWAHREAYSKRIYYRGQISPPRYKAMYSRAGTEQRIKELMKPERRAYAYAGRITKRAARLFQLQERYTQLCNIEWDMSKGRPNITNLVTRQNIAGLPTCFFNPAAYSMTKREDFYSYEMTMPRHELRRLEQNRLQLQYAAMLMPR
ncbi:MAG: hypothetical protein EOP56_18030 [Sphingobacteriales bacterium]|nr:MAG: hypothetical protein EOP56_18030 [Sphingobacteriales bacterium]